MKRDTLKTIAGLIIIAGIVVATFLYGNSQRQAQLTRDQNIKKQQDAKAQQAKAVTPSPTAPAATATATPNQTAANTAPVQSPGSSAIQGSGAKPTATPTPSVAPTPTPVIAVTTPAAGATMPAAGPEMIGLLGIGSMTGMVVAFRRSRRAVIAAARNKPHQS